MKAHFNQQPDGSLPPLEWYDVESVQHALKLCWCLRIQPPVIYVTIDDRCHPNGAPIMVKRLELQWNKNKGGNTQ